LKKPALPIDKINPFGDEIPDACFVCGLFGLDRRQQPGYKQKVKISLFFNRFLELMQDLSRGVAGHITLPGNGHIIRQYATIVP
jgi:hypothetical protein